MQINLTGVLNDGTAYANAVPRDTRAQIVLVQGASMDIDVRVLLPTGAGAPSSGQVTFGVKKKAAEGALIKKTATYVGGVWRITLTPADTKQMSVGYYIYDVWFTLGGKRDPVIPLSPLMLMATATPIP